MKAYRQPSLLCALVLLTLGACQDVIAPISDQAKLCIADTDCDDTFFCSGGRCLRPSGPRCGDGKLDGQEACDDGNRDDADACVNCQVARCGDGAVHLGVEGCDAGDDVNADEAADACRTDCSLARCGDGAVDSGESCDEGVLNNNEVADRCRDDCSSPRCGDGVIDSGETCDDTNTTDTDACTNACQVARCGDGVVRTDLPESDLHYEFCDDANTNDEDDCDRFCGRGLVSVARNYRGSTCVAQHNGDVWCWGAIVQTDRAPTLRPKQVHVPGRVVEIIHGRYGFIGRTQAGQVYAWRGLTPSGGGQDVPSVRLREHFYQNTGHIDCLQDGTILRKYLDSDQLADRTFSGDLIDCALVGTRLGLRESTKCALLRAPDATQQLYCAGHYNVGDGGTASVSQPVRVPIDDVIDFRFIGERINAYDGLCARDRQRQLWCWVDDITNPQPVKVEGIPELGSLNPVWRRDTGQMGDIRYDAQTETWTFEATHEVDRPRSGKYARNGYYAVIDGDGRLWARGTDHYGMQGVGLRWRYRPVRVANLGAVTQVAMGDRFSCAQRRDENQIDCWGGTATARYTGMVRGDSRVNQYSEPPTWAGTGRDVASGWEHSCAVDPQDRISCWGARRDRVRYIHGEASFDLPDARVAESLALGDNHSCARSQGEVYCWGANDAGQLGIGDLGSSETPTLVYGLSDVVEISANRGHTCALNALGEVWCWGANHHGQVGQISSEAEWTPVRVGLAFPAAQVSAGASHTCVLSREGTVHCWGGEYNATGLVEQESIDDFEGQVRNADFASILGLTGAVWVSAGNDYGCAVTAAGEVRCWSQGIIDDPQEGEEWRHLEYFYAMGDRRYEGPGPRDVQGLPPVVRVQAGDRRACATTAAGEVWCWGDNATNQLGDGYADTSNGSLGLVDRLDREWSQGE